MATLTPETSGWQDRVVRRSLRDATSQTIERAEALLAATAELLETNADFTVQEIADRAGVSLRVLYRHFASKDDLLLAVLEDRLVAAAAASREHLMQLTDPVERLAGFLLWTADAPATPAHLALARNALLLTVTSADDVRRTQAPMAEVARELMAAAADAGCIDPAMAVAGAYVLLELRRTYNYARLFGSELGLDLPPIAEQIRFGLRGLGVTDDSIDRALAGALGRPR